MSLLYPSFAGRQKQVGLAYLATRGRMIDRAALDFGRALRAVHFSDWRPFALVDGSPGLSIGTP
jgi:hypothetical protein